MTEITQELKDKVIRAYVEKKMGLATIGKLVCPRKVAEKILQENNIELREYGYAWKEIENAKLRNKRVL
jgi:hypothetical protein